MIGGKRISTEAGAEVSVSPARDIHNLTGVSDTNVGDVGEPGRGCSLVVGITTRLGAGLGRGLTGGPARAARAAV